jgi:solute carrier family 35 protein
MACAWPAVKGPTRAALVAGLYFLCSLSMNFLNKAVLSSYGFNYPFFLMACQMAVTVVLLEVLHSLQLVNLPPFTIAEAVQLLPCSIGFGLHATLSLIALHGMNIPMYGAIKRCTPLANLVLSVLVLKRPFPSALLSSSIGLITVGAFVASLGDLQFDGVAYTMGVLAMAAQAAYLTMVQYGAQMHQRSTLEMLRVTSSTTLPAFFALSVAAGELAGVRESLVTAEPGLRLALPILLLSGTLLNWSQFLCAALCSALTTSMVGVAKSAIQTVLGFFTFGGVVFHPLNVLGLGMNVVGGLAYAYTRHMGRAGSAGGGQV